MTNCCVIIDKNINCIVNKNPVNSLKKTSAKFHCENCHYHTSRFSQYERHKMTSKHKRINMNNLMDNVHLVEPVQPTSSYTSKYPSEI